MKTRWHCGQGVRTVRFSCSKRARFLTARYCGMARLMLRSGPPQQESPWGVMGSISSCGSIALSASSSAYCSVCAMQPGKKPSFLMLICGCVFCSVIVFVPPWFFRVVVLLQP